MQRILNIPFAIMFYVIIIKKNIKFKIPLKKEIGLLLNTSFLLSNWYSGATLFSLIIDKHPDIVCNGETFPFSKNDRRRYKCSCDSYIDKCDFYSAVTEIHSEKKFPDSWDYKYSVICPEFINVNFLNSYFSSPRRDSSFRDFISKTLKIDKKEFDFLQHQIEMKNRALLYNKAKRYVDGTKSIRRLQLFAKHFKTEKINVVHLVRDGRAFCNSFRKNRKINENQIILAAQEWNEYIELVDEIQRRHTNINLLTIRYEDICRERDKFTGKFFNLLDISSFNDFRNSIKQSHMLGNRMRKDFTFDIKEDLSWKHELSKDSIDTISKIMSKNLSRYGYVA